MSIIAKARQIYSGQGVGALACAVRRRIYDRHHSVWFRLPLSESKGVIAPKFDGRLDFEHPDRVLSWIGEKASPGIYDPVETKTMKERGHLYVGVMNGETIIGYIKLGWDLVYVVDYGLDLHIPAGDYFIIDIFIDPSARGLGAGPFLVSAAVDAMKQRGFVGSIMHIRTDKEPMLRTAARTGYHRLGDVDYFSLCGRKIFRPHPDELIARAGHPEEKRVGG